MNKIRYKIKLDHGSETSFFYFVIVDYTKKMTYDTSMVISDLLEVDLDEYNKRVINDVIKNKYYSIYDGSSTGRRLYRDLTFSAIEENETYIERLKEVFCKELTSLSIGC